MRSPLRSMRPTISPIRPRCTPSGLTRTRVFSLFGTVEQPTDRPRPAVSDVRTSAAVVVVRRLRNRLAVVLDVVDPVLVPGRVQPADVGHDEGRRDDGSPAHASHSV